MAITVKTRVEVKVTTETTENDDTNPLLAPVTQVGVFAYDRTFQSGTGTSQFNRAYVATRELVASTPQDVDLSGSLVTPHGTSIVMTKLGVLGLHNKSTVATQKILALGDAASVGVLNTLATTLNLGPDGLVLLVNPIDKYTVTAATGDIIQLDPAAVAIDCNMVAVGNT